MHYVGYALEALLFGFLFAAAPLYGVVAVVGPVDSWINVASVAVPCLAGLAFASWYFWAKTTYRLT